MKERDLRAKVEKRRSFTDEEWDYLCEEGYVGDALEQPFSKEQVEYLIKQIDRLPNRAGKRRTSGDKGREETIIESEPFDVKLTDAETERARWLLDIQIRYATEDPHVAEFRERNLSNGLLSHKQAEEFLGSANAREATAVASHLKKFHGWHEGEAAWWMLTGESPSARPLRVSYRESHSRFSPDLYLIGLEAPPWISVETLAGAFAEMKRRMNAERKLPDARSYRAARFIEARLPKAGANKPTFEDMQREWNQENPGEEFPDYRTFRKVYNRLPVERITYPPYTTKIERTVTPEMQRQLDRNRTNFDQVAQRFKSAESPVRN